MATDVMGFLIFGHHHHRPPPSPNLQPFKREVPKFSKPRDHDTRSNGAIGLPHVSRSAVRRPASCMHSRSTCCKPQESKAGWKDKTNHHSTRGLAALEDELWFAMVFCPALRKYAKSSQVAKKYPTAINVIVYCLLDPAHCTKTDQRSEVGKAPASNSSQVDTEDT